MEGCGWDGCDESEAPTPEAWGAVDLCKKGACIAKASADGLVAARDPEKSCTTATKQYGNIDATVIATTFDADCCTLAATCESAYKSGNLACGAAKEYDTAKAATAYAVATQAADCCIAEATTCGVKSSSLSCPTGQKYDSSLKDTTGAADQATFTSTCCKTALTCSATTVTCLDGIKLKTGTVTCDSIPCKVSECCENDETTCYGLMNKVPLDTEAGTTPPKEVGTCDNRHEVPPTVYGTAVTKTVKDFREKCCTATKATCDGWEKVKGTTAAAFQQTLSGLVAVVGLLVMGKNL
jgi:hypothetical protein